MTIAYKALLEQRLALQKQLEPIQAEIAKIESEALQELQEGKPVQGFTLKKGRKTRKVKDEAILVQSVTELGIPRSALYDAKLKGVPALDKLLKETFTKEVASALYSKCIEETIGKPTLEYTGE